jgi:hypothetical protein
MTFRTRSLLARARKLNRQVRPIFLRIVGNPDRRMWSARMASVDGDYVEQGDDESLEAFKARLKSAAEAKGARLVIFGYDHGDHARASAWPSNLPPGDVGTLH